VVNAIGGTSTGSGDRPRTPVKMVSISWKQA
jgi:hypothetical protein